MRCITYVGCSLGVADEQPLPKLERRRNIMETTNNNSDIEFDIEFIETDSELLAMSAYVNIV